MKTPRPIPSPMLVANFGEVPWKLLTDRRLTPTARLLGAVLAARGGPHGGPMAVSTTNKRLIQWTGEPIRVLQRAFLLLEKHGYVRRLTSWDELGLDALQWAGYRDPWIAAGKPRPRRAIVLCWRLPQPLIREPGRAVAGAPDRAGSGTPKAADAGEGHR